MQTQNNEFSLECLAAMLIKFMEISLCKKHMPGKSRSDRAGRYRCSTDPTQISPFTKYMHMNAVSDFYIEL